MRDQLSVRLPHGLKTAMAEQARRDARRPSDIVRLALQVYLKKSESDRRSRPDRAREDRGARAWGESASPVSERTIVLHGVPEDLCEALEDRAAREGLSVSDYVLDILARRQFRERLRSRPRVKLSVSAADLVREGRDSR